MGRSAERSRLHRLLAAAMDGRGRAVVLRGEAGIGKTALLDYAADIARGFRTLRVVGVESEAEIPFAGLQLMLSPFADRLDDLPTLQARTLRGALGSTATVGDGLLVGAATLALLSELADERPLLCLVDDAHWFDQASTAAVLFAVRRLHSDPVAAVFAARDGDRPFPAPGIDSLVLPRLGPKDAARLVATVRALPPDVVERVVDESDGNPLAVLEFAASNRLGVVPPPVAPLPTAGRLDELFRARLRSLPEQTRLALLLAAADTRSELTVFSAAAQRLGIQVGDLEPAEMDRLVQVTSGAVLFRHPLIRAAAYQDAPLMRRVTAHQALAAALDDRRDADRRAWHLAAAAVGVDDDAAVELDHAADRALTRGAPVAASRAWERAAGLSSSPAEQARRLVSAARAAYDAGEFERADELAVAGGALTSDIGERAEAAWVRAQIAYERESPARASLLALDAAEPLLESDPEHATAVLTEAIWCARDAADPALLARCAEMLGRIRGDRGMVVAALAGFVDLLCGTPATATPSVRSFLLAARDGRIDRTVERLAAGFLGTLIGEDVIALALLDEHVAALRRDGALGWLPYAQEPLALAQLVAGRLHDAEVTVTEATSLAEDLGQGLQVTVLASFSAWLAAVRGDATTYQHQYDRVVNNHRGHKMALAIATWARAIVNLTRAEPARALDDLDRVCRGTALGDITIRAIPDYVEAAVRSGNPDRSLDHLSVLQRWATETASPVAKSMSLRCEAILADGEAAQDLFKDSLRVAGCGPYDQARTQLVYGEWLRRHRRPSAARDVLNEALGTFDRIAAQGWSGRVEAELVALGVSPPDRSSTTAANLTPQELQVVRLAGDGLTNREIGAQLFLSPRTVGHHLYKAYPKLGVNRRTELARLDL